MVDKLNSEEVFTLVLDGFRVGEVGFTKIPRIGEVLRTDFGKFVVESYGTGFSDEIFVKKFVGGDHLR